MNILKWLFKPSPETLGKHGEDAIVSKLYWGKIFGRKGQILQNVYVPTGNGYDVEIDVLFITAKGLFVIESKNYTGYIFGDENSRNWTSTLYAGKNIFGFKEVEKHHFYNPIWQNKTHINCLKRYLGYDVPMYSIIVFSDRCEFKRLNYTPENQIVCHKGSLGYELERIWDKFSDVFTDSQVTETYNRLLPLTYVDEAARARHVDQIRNRQYDSNRCPLCGGRLVVRMAKRGPYEGNRFYGCSNYPRCSYTKNID